MKGKKKKEEAMSKVQDEEKMNEDVDTEEEEGEDEVEKGCLKKSDAGITGEDLQKSLDQLEELTTSTDTTSRKDVLLEQASEGTLEKADRDELFELLGGKTEEPQDDTVGDSIVKSMEDNADLGDALDVSDYLREQHTELVKSLSAVGDEIEKSDNRRMEFDLTMAKALHDIGTMVKGMAENMGDFLEQPARAPKSRGLQRHQVLQKSFGGELPDEENLSKSMIFSTLEEMVQDSMTKGMDGRIASGEDITLAVSKYEQTNAISPTMLTAIKDWRNQRATH